jgi:hypothetical protein
MDENAMTDEERIDAALAQLENRPFDDPMDAMPPAPPEPPTSADPARGPTLTALDPSRLPKNSTVCETCPLSLWFASERELRCYCRLMFTITWDNADPRPLSHCDGPTLPPR